MALSWFVYLGVSDKEKFRLLRKWSAQCKFFIKVRTAGVCFPHRAKDTECSPGILEWKQVMNLMVLILQEEAGFHLVFMYFVAMG